MQSEVKAKYEAYPPKAQQVFLQIRNAIFDVAQSEDLGSITETLKWGEPSYCVKNGSTLRVDWKAKSPNQISVYFNCNTILIETFKTLFGNSLRYEANREIIFDLSQKIPWRELKMCISFSFRYHTIKKLPLLGF